MKIATKILILMLTVAILATLALPIFASANKPDISYYGREALGKLDNREALLYAYDSIVESVERSAAEIELTHGTGKLSEKELKTVYDAYVRDHTEHFWLGTRYEYTKLGDSVKTLKPSYTMTGTALDTARARFNEACATILRGIDLTASQYEIELKLHDILADKVTYVLDAPNAHNAYGAIVEGKAVCEGYAEALQHLLIKAGIRSFIIIGTSKNPTSQKDEGHAWCAVEIDGQFYHVDPTWNDQGSQLYHAYFNVSDQTIKKDHVIEATEYKLPSCGSESQNYFNVSGKRITEPYTAKDVAALFSAESKEASFKVADGTDGFIEWLKENVNQVAEKLMIKGSFSYNLTYLADEVYLKFNVCTHDSLTKVSANPASCTENGNLEYYVCSCGAWFKDIAATEPIITKSTVTVYSVGHSWTAAAKDDAHKRSDPESCLEHDTYWFTCSECGKISDTEYFNGERIGEHKLDEKGHCTLCSYPEKPEGDNDGFVISFNLEFDPLIVGAVAVVALIIIGAVIAIVIKKR